MTKTDGLWQLSREHDACGLFACFNRHAGASRHPILMGMEALDALSHRAGRVLGEGDGCGLMTDIPRGLWASWLKASGADPLAAYQSDFAACHLLLPSGVRFNVDGFTELVSRFGGTVLLVREGAFNKSFWGPLAREEDPSFVQIAVSVGETLAPKLKHAIESELSVHVASLSHDTVVYKVVGDGQTLWKTYSDLQDEDFVSTFSMAHTRYSTNTKTSFTRVQPFSVLGHNGEINTIRRFHSESLMVGTEVREDSSDSQMVNEFIETLTKEHSWSLFEAAELVFPPIINEISRMPEGMADVYRMYRAMWGPFSQGPAAMVIRSGHEAVLTVDAMGLRPLWVVETEDAICASSEQGIIPPQQWVSSPRSLSPGEKVGLVFTDEGVHVWHYDELREEVVRRAKGRFPEELLAKKHVMPERAHSPARQAPPVHRFVRAAAFGWNEDDLKLLQDHARTGNEPIRSLGYDGPIGALRTGPRLVSDFLQETVAVVTNPAVDREREVEHFSTRVVLGKRPKLVESGYHSPRVELPSPLLLDVLPVDVDVDADTVQMLALHHNTMCYDDALWLLHDNPTDTLEVLFACDENESAQEALRRLVGEVIEAVSQGARAVVLDDRLQFRQGGHLDPFVVTATVHRALAATFDGGEALRRRTSLILRSHGVRNLHDVMVAVGLGADSVVPVMMWELAADQGGVQGLDNVYTALCKGVEKVLSTLGIHELRGYERLFSAIGITSVFAQALGIETALGSDTAGYGWKELEETSLQLAEIYKQNDSRVLSRQKEFRIYPRVWKLAGQVAEDRLSYEEYRTKLEELESLNPISIRHLLGLKESQVPTSADDVDTSVDIHDYPFLISSMSFGSQGETAYRAYAEAASRLNMVAMNGEGGELKDLLNKYPRHRGRQVASGRFGVNAALCNDAYVLEIKIGQGAKPGEGGHLPGSKVTPLVASARNASPGTDLISPSNHHDIYSIEDLEQVIFELRTVNPNAKIAVKVPVVPNIGTIGIGIAKAGADVVVLSGFDGGTGAARAHALQRVGLPVEIGVRRVHQALCDAGLRNDVEIWADGGMKSAKDAMMAILLGANRIGFGTMAMVALGCTACRACHKDTCHVGIATQITSREEAQEKGLPRFEPRESEAAVQNLVRFFRALGTELKRLTVALGETRTQNLVGRVDLLEQVTGQNILSCEELLTVRAEHRGLGTSIRFRDADVLLGRHSESLDNSMELLHAEAVGRENIATAETLVGRGSRTASVYLMSSQYSGMQSAGIRQLVRGLGTKESGALIRANAKGQRGPVSADHTAISAEGVGGNGFAAYITSGIHISAQGGAQDGVAKGAFGGKTVVLKTRGKNGKWIGGSVGKGLGYGAQHGLIIVQGNADARAGVRLSGADIIIGGEVEHRLEDHFGYLASRSNVKGFAFEYMTAGRALVLGDPGPWICSGMTGGRVYLRVNPGMGLTESALRRRLAKGAKVRLSALDRQGEIDVENLLLSYHRELRQSGQVEAAKALSLLLASPSEHFRMVEPGAEQTDQDVATE